MKQTFFGQYLLAEGIVTAPQLLAAVERQEQFNSRLGEYAVALGCITRFEAEKINALQTERNLKFGEAAMELGLFDRAQLRDMIKKQRNEHLRLGEALAALGYVKEEAISAAFGRFLQQSGESAPLEIPEGHAHPKAAEHFFGNVQLLLARAWNLPNKTRHTVHRNEQLLLSDRNAILDVTGDLAAVLALGVPHDIVHRVVTGEEAPEESPSDDICEQAVCDFLERVGENLKNALAEEACSVEVSGAKSCTFRIGLDETRTAMAVPYLTHGGQVIAALIT